MTAAPWKSYKNLSDLEAAVADADNSAVFRWLTGDEEFETLAPVALRSLLRESLLWLRVTGDQTDYYCHYRTDESEFWAGVEFPDGQRSYVSVPAEEIDEAILAAQTYRGYSAKLLLSSRVPEWHSTE